MKIDKKNPKHLIADEGKVLRRIVGFPMSGNDVVLGKVLIDGEIVDDTIENYEEVEEPKEDK